MNKRTIRTKRIWSMLLAAVLIVSVVTPAVAATARATTMKLEKTEGTVTLKTQNGSSRKPTNGMRLLNGNTLATAASSYAHISLDGTKAVKLDQNSSTTVRQSGKQLELLVKSGQLFFNVSEKLTQKESLNIRTSSMVAGIRGTCGVVEKVNPAMSKLYLIEGQVTLGTGENAVTVQGGQTATVILRPKNETGESGGSDGSGTPGDPGSTTEQMEQKVYVDKLTEKAVPVFAITEILSNPVLQQKIEATTELKIEKLKEALAESQKEPGAEEKEEEKKPEETPSSGGGYVPSVPSTPTSTELSADIATSGAINAAFDTYDVVTLTAGESTSDSATGNQMITLSEVSVPSGKKLVLASATNIAESVESDQLQESIQGKITVASGGELVIDVNGSLYNYGQLINNGTLTNNGTLENYGPFTNNGIFTNSGTFTNSNTLDNTGTINNSRSIINEDTITDTGKGIKLENGSTLTNNFEITGNITLSGQSELINNQNCTITGGITLGSGSTLTNSGTMTATSPWSVTNATIDNTGTIDMGANAISVTGSLNLSSVGTITGEGGAVISLTERAALTLGSGNSPGGSISNTSEISDTYAITAVSDSTITWNDTGVTISTGTGQIEKTIQGLTLSNGDITDENGILQGGIVNQLTWVDAEKMLCFQR